MESLPRGPLYSGENDNSADSPDNYARDLLNWRESAREEAFRTARIDEEYNNRRRYIDVISGNQWSSKRPPYKSKYVNNKVNKARIDLLAYLTDSRPSISVTSEEALEEQAEAIKRTMEYEWTNENIDLDLIRAVDIAMMGTAFWKIGASWPGHTRITPCGPDCVFPIQPGLELQESTAVMYRVWKSLQYARDKFPMHSAYLEREASRNMGDSSSVGYARPNHIHEITWNAMSRGLKQLLGRRIDIDPSRDMFKSLEWQEFYIEDSRTNDSTRRVLMRDPHLALDKHNWWYYVEPGERLYPRKRLLVFAGKRPVYDGPAPFFHGLFPFACLRLNPVYWNFYGLSILRDLIPLNAAINEIGAGVLDAVKRALNQAITVKRNSAPEAALREFLKAPDAPGASLIMNPTAIPQQDIRYIDPPNLPDYVMKMAEHASTEFDRMSGLIDITQMTGKKQVPGGDTIEQMRDTMQAPIRLYVKYIEAFLRDAGIQAISNIIQFYGMKRRMQILGADGITIHDFPFDPQKIAPALENKFDHWRQFKFHVAPGSLHGGAKDRDKQMAVALRQGGNISLKELLRRLDIQNIDQILNELGEEAQQMMAAQDGTGVRMTRGQRNGQAV